MLEMIFIAKIIFSNAKTLIIKNKFNTINCQNLYNLAIKNICFCHKNAVLLIKDRVQDCHLSGVQKPANLAGI